MAAAWEKHGTKLGPLAQELGIPPADAVAILCVESGGQGFGADGRLIIRFENHVFWKRWGSKTPQNKERFNARFRFDPAKKWLGHKHRWQQENDAAEAGEWRASHRSQASEWEALGIARAMDDGQALCSTSMGCAQLMGFNYSVAGYGSVQEMFAAFGDAEAGEGNQIMAMFRFIGGTVPGARKPQGKKTAPAMLEAIRRNDLVRFAELYNGPGKAKEYGDKLRRMRDAFVRIPV